MGAKKLRWECVDCETVEEWKRGTSPAFCGCGGNMECLDVPKGNGKKMQKFIKLYKGFLKDRESEVYEGSLEVCECEPPQVCDICQGMEKGYETQLDNLECIECGKFKHPNRFIGDGVCFACHEEQHSEEPIGAGHYYEIMDRTHMIQCIIDDHLSDHPAMTPKIRKHLNKVQKKLCKVYQWAGTKHNNHEHK
jgi:hypothetical protein